MSIRVDVQNTIREALLAGTFKKVVYNSVTHAAEDTVEDSVPNVYVNETTGTIDNSSQLAGRGQQYSWTKWPFEAKVKFHDEVDISTFIATELKDMAVHTNGVMVQIKTSGYNVNHPTQKGVQGGTVLTMTFNATTRR